MSSNYWPSETSASPTIEGMLNPQGSGPFSFEIPMPTAPPPQEPQAGAFTQGMGGIADVIGGVSQTLPAALDNARAFQAQLQASREPEPPPIGSITRKADGTTDLKGVSSKFLEDVMGQMTDLKTMKAAAMAQVAKYRQQEQSGSPILDALSQFAGGMAANDPTMPGWVRALGATSLQMGNQGIERKRLAEEQRVLQYGEASAGLAQSLMRMQEASQQKRTAEEDRQAQLKISQQNADTAAAAQKGTVADRDADNFRQELSPVMAEVKATGRFNSDMENGMRAMAATHPNISPAVVDAQVKMAKGAADAAYAEIQRKVGQRQSELAQKAALDAQQQAQREGRQINVAVVRAQLGQADKMATQARLDVKTDAPRLQSLNEMAIVNKRMRERLEADPLWQGPITGPIAEKTYLTTSQQAMLADQAKAFIAKMGIAGLSFAKTSDAEMKKILASVVNNRMTVAMAKQTLDIIDAEGKRAAEQIGRDKWATNPEDLAARMPDIYREPAMQAFNDQRSRLNGRQRLALGLATGDEGLVSAEMGGITGALRGDTGEKAPPNSTRPGEIRMAAPKPKMTLEDMAKFLGSK